MFKQIFNKKSNGLSKIEYWKKWELFELFEHLYRAERFLLDIKEDNQNQLSDFKQDFIEELYDIKGHNVVDFTRVWEWFSPTKEWETFTGQSGKELGINIFRITDKWKRNQEFLKGTKVLLGNEFGVVLDKTEDNKMYGLIRWDSAKENDIEDWRGLFGCFIQLGGQIINQDHKFSFIEDNGEIKKSYG